VDISTVSKLSKLWTLYLGSNKVTNIQPVQALKNLTSLDFSQNQIVDLGPLKSLKSLNYLRLDQNKISDISTLVAMAQADAKADNRFSMFWRIYLTGNALNDPKQKQGMEALKKLGCRLTY
jgi:Leucine-rich repeat (LRR) protein